MIKPVSLFHPVQSLQTVFAIVLFIAMAGTVLAALGFQYIGGLLPCSLCLMERVPYYIGAPLMLVAAVLSATRVPGIYVRGLFIAALLLMIYGFALSAYHSGVEWKLWAGPAGCSLSGASMPENAGNLLDTLNTLRPVSCSEAAGYFLGLSMAGWNAVASFGYAALAALAALAAFISCNRQQSADC